MHDRVGHFRGAVRLSHLGLGHLFLSVHLGASIIHLRLAIFHIVSYVLGGDK